MPKYVLVFLPFLLLHTLGYNIQREGCLVSVDNSVFFNFKPLVKTGSEYGVDIVHTIDQRNILLFNICEKPATCPNAFASTYQSDITEPCYALTSDNDDDVVMNYYENSNLTEFNTTIVELSYYKTVDAGFDSEKILHFRLRMVCDTHYPDSPHIEIQYNTTNPTYTIMFSHSTCCKAIGIESIWRFIEQYYLIVGLVCVIVGFGFAFFGNKILKVVIVFSTGIIFMVVMTGVIYTYINPSFDQKWQKWALLGGTLVVGMALALLILKIIKLGLFLLGAFGGVAPGLILYEGAIHYIAPNSQEALYITIGATALLCGILMLWVTHHAVIVITSIMGGYLFVRGLSFFIGGYPNEFLLYAYFTNRELKEIPYEIYYYLGSMLGVAILGIMIQEKVVKPDDINDDYKKVQMV